MRLGTHAIEAIPKTSNYFYGLFVAILCFLLESQAKNLAEYLQKIVDVLLILSGDNVYY